MNIKLNQFEGPLSLLLKLIEKEELDVTEISLARIADQFVTYIRQSSNIGPEEMADFLVVASRLLLIKSKALLPYLYPEEEKEIEELESVLRMYKEFVEASRQIEKMIGKKKFMFAREFNRRAFLSGHNVFSPPKNLRADEMKTVFADLVNRLRPPEKLEEKKIRKKINIEDRIFHIQSMLLTRIKVSFSKVMAGSKNKTELIVSFLAMLELMRQRHVVLEQSELFGEIEIKNLNI